MLFHSTIFLFFFAAVFVLYWTVAHRIRKYLLIAASFVFYAYFSRLFLLHFLAIVCLNYLFYYIYTNFGLLKGGRQGISNSEPSFQKARHKKRYSRSALLMLLIFNLGNLIFFKYFYFLSEGLFWLLPETTAQALRKELALFPEIILPLAISFYTFQILAFQIDVYRGEIQEKVSFSNFILFIMFFPQLIAGPIMRHSEFLPRIEVGKRPRSAWMRQALFWFLLGIVKKTLIADRLAVWIDPVFASPERYDRLSQLWAMYGFSIQIYCDFSGYTDMARGLALALGFRIPANFRGPYFSHSFREFWQRWHITLSSWLRDYLYIPLGGNRHGALRMLLALFVTMLLGGLWHGASFLFLIWGGLHGLFLILERLPGILGWKRPVFLELRVVRDTRLRVFLERLGRGLRIVFVFHLVTLAWIFFRSPSLGQALAMLRGLLGFGDAQAEPLSLGFSSPIGLSVLLFVYLHYFEYQSGKKADGRVRKGKEKKLPSLPASVLQGRFAYWALLGMLGPFLILLAYGGESFIYFQF